MLASILLLLGIAQVHAELYTAVGDMKLVASFQVQLTRKLSGEYNELPWLRKMIDLNECLFDTNGLAVINPISAIKMLSLFTIDLENERMQRPELFQLIKHEAAAANVTLPTNVDLVGSINALARLQMTYGVTISQVMQGYFTELHRSPMPAVCADRLRPDAYDCSVIANYLKTHQPILVALSQLWMYEAVRLSEESGRLSLLDAVRKHATGSSNIAKTLKQFVEKADTDPLFQLSNAIESLRQAEINVTLGPVSDALGSVLQGYDRAWNEYMRLCQASATETYIPEKDRKTRQLLCAYSTLNTPYFLIGPVKTEWISDEPEVRVYYDVVHESEIAVIKSLARRSLSRSGLLFYSADHYEQRVSKTAWLTLPQGDPDSDEMVKRLNHRSNLLARLNAEGTEDPQVLNYGLGGQYEPHYDYLPEPSDNYWVVSFGNRIATLMFYLSDVDAGGSTVFTRLGVGVHPQKGSAVFWYNLVRNGQIDAFSMHAGCPVLVGEKWVVNKWYHAKPQFNTRLCHLHPEL